MWLRSSGLPLHGRRRIERSAVFVAWLAGPGGTSSLRTQGPILRGCCCWKRRTIATSQDNFGRWLWVPAFAGTTKEISDSIQKKVTHLRDLAAHCARALHLRLALLEIRGRREDRVLAAPAVSRAICANKSAHEHTGQREHSGLPCAMALRLTSCSSRRTALLPPSPALPIARLTPAPRRPNHTTSPYAPGAYVSRLPHPSHLTARS